MNKILKLTLANLRTHPIRLLLTSLATTAAVCLVIWIASGYEALRSTFDEYAHLALGRYALSIAPIATANPAPVPNDVLASMRNDPAVAVADPMMIAKLRVAKVILPSSPATSSTEVKSKEAELTANAGPNFHGPDYEIIFTDSPSAPFDLLQGRWLAREKAELEVVLRKDAAKRLGIEVGQEVLIGSNNRQLTLRVAGIVGAPSLTNYGAAALPVLTPSTGELYVSSVLAERLTGMPLHTSLIGIALHPEADLTKFRFSWAPRLSKFSNPVQFQDAHDIEEALDQSASAHNVLLQSYAAAGIAMLVSLLVIYCTLSMGINERIRQLAILRAIGFTRSQVVWLITWESFILAGIGFLAGLLVSYGGMAIIANRNSSTLYHGINIGVHGIMLAALVTFGGASLAAVFAARFANRVKPLDAISSAMQFTGSRTISWWRTTIGICLILVNPLLAFIFPPSSEFMVMIYMALGFVSMSAGFLAIAPTVVQLADRLLSPIVCQILRIDSRLLSSQITVHLWRTIGAAISLAVGLSLYIGIQVWGFTMLSAFVPGPWAPDALIAFKPTGLEPRFFKNLSTVDGINSEQFQPIIVEQPRFAEDIMGSADRATITRQDNVVIVGIDPDCAFGKLTPLFSLEWIAGTPQEAIKIMRDGKGCIVPDHFLTESKLKIGDAIELVPPENPGNKVKYTIAGAVRLPGWHWQTKLTGFRTRTHRTSAMIFADYQQVARDFGFQAATHVWFNYSKPTIDPDQLISKVRDELSKVSGKAVVIGELAENVPHIHMMPIEGIRKVMMNNAKRWIWLISQVPLLAMLIAGLGVINVMYASVRARRWELGVLRAIGFTRAVLSRAIIAEGLLIGLVACLISLVFGILAGWCGCAFAQHISFFGGLHPPLVVPWKGILIGLMFTLILTTLTSLLPALVMGRTKPLRLLQEGRSMF